MESNATGVRTSSGDEIAAGEVIVSSGAYGSPALLMRSGIGPADHLGEFGITALSDLPGVGQHLLDHPLTSMLGPVTILPEFAPEQEVFVPLLITARSSQTDEEIDLHLYHGQFLDGDTWKIWIVATLQLARSEGVVRLTGPNASNPLHIDHRYLSDPRDLEALCDGVEMAAQIFDSPMMNRVLAPERSARWSNRDELREMVRLSVDTTFHPSSTCRMGPASDPKAVVDHTGRVHGVENLRVIDASIFPTGPRCNLLVPTFVVAEHIAEMMSA
jgi:choline dehydrogenase